VSTPLEFKQHLGRGYAVRLHMTVIVLATAAAGALVSKILLEAGLTNMLVRYPLSAVGAYLVFLGLARLWSSYVLWRESACRRGGGTGSPDWLDVLDGASSTGRSGVDVFGGGESGGAGASGTWEPAHFDAAGLDFDLGEAAGVVIVLVGLILVLFGAGIYVIYWAPEILPEAALSKPWIYGLLRSTRIALAVALITSFGLAVTLHHACPRAEKLADTRACMPTR